MPISPSTGLSRSFREVLLVKLSSLGDVVHALQAASFLDRLGLRVFWLTEEHYLPLVKRVPFVERVFTPKEIFSGFKRFELAIDMQGLIKSAVVSRFLGKQVGGFHFSHLREPVAGIFYHVRVRPKETHIVEQLRDLLCELLHLENCGDYRVSFVLEERDYRRVESFLPERYALLFPGAGWSTKSLPLWWCQRFVGVWCENMDVSLFVVPGLGETPRLYPLSGYLLPEFDVVDIMALISKSIVVIAPDTGFLHLAAAMGVPSVGLYCASDPLRNGPFGERVAVVECNCQDKGCFKRRCPNLCTSSIDPCEVVDKVASLLYSQI